MLRAGGWASSVQGALARKVGDPKKKQGSDSSNERSTLKRNHFPPGPTGDGRDAPPRSIGPAPESDRTKGRDSSRPRGKGAELGGGAGRSPPKENIKGGRVGQ